MGYADTQSDGTGTDGKGALRVGCTLNGQCAYFSQQHMESLDGLSSLYRSRYCESDHERCARFKVMEVFTPTDKKYTRKTNF